MKIPEKPFNIQYPLKILNPEEMISLDSKEKRTEIFSRNLYFNLSSDHKNPFFESRYQDFIHGSKNIINDLADRSPKITPLNISVFGSALFTKDPLDYDFLVITEGDMFLNENGEFKTAKGRKIKSEISIKGLEHFERGYTGPKQEDPKKRLEQIIDRTAVSLFRRHLPVWGHDFVNNEGIFLENIYAQISDLLRNTFHIFYSETSNRSLKDDEKCRKILSRVYQAVTYLERIGEDAEVSSLRGESYHLMDKGTSLKESRALFERFVDVYTRKLEKDGNNNYTGGRLHD